MENHWEDPEHAAHYLARADELPHRHEAEAVLLGDLEPVLPGRVLDAGCGGGRLTGLVLDAFPGSTAVGVDLSPTMLEVARGHLPADGSAVLVRHDLERPLPAGAPFDRPFDAVVSSFAVHHVDGDRKRTLYAELAGMLAPGGILANLDIVASPTPALHRRWRDEMGAEDDPADHLADLAPQLAWLRDAGLDDVDCIWKWRSLSLMRGRRP
ncbi:MAG: class I SAM-dependent methyltransferase [Acidimicrobiales bacterium]